VLIDDGELDADAVIAAADSIFSDQARLERMSRAAAGLAMPDAAERIADRILEAASGRKTVGR
jgi:UDP-N-acetylglucosamine:LPS N-acetylglucosamine transferase